MSINISIRNVPNDVLARLKARAKTHHRSLQGELLTILKETVMPRRCSIREVHERIAELGLRTGPESASLIRDRDKR